MLRSRADVALIVLGILVFVVGSIVLARPFTKRKSTLFVAVPVGAAAGIAVLGVIALAIGAVIAVVESPGDVDWSSVLSSLSSWTPGSGRNRRK
jgi:hypothetical protein